MALIAIDPGKATGFAYFDGLGRLEDATVCTYAECRRFIQNNWGGGDCIIEIPQVYPGQQQKGDQNDLIALAVEIGRCVECASAGYFKITLVKPREWKGQMPKDVCWQRVRESLTAHELEKLAKVPKSKAHNMHDAIGLGTWFQKRWR